MGSEGQQPLCWVAGLTSLLRSHAVLRSSAPFTFNQRGPRKEQWSEGGAYLPGLFIPQATFPVDAIKSHDTSSCSLELDSLTMRLCIMGRMVIFIHCFCFPSFCFINKKNLYLLPISQ